MSKSATASVARSLLFVPGDRSERFDKAVASGANQVILDLEDAVAPVAKVRAREAVGNWLASGRPAIVRINSTDTEWYAGDIRMIQAAPQALVMLPKSELDSLSLTSGQLPDRRLIALVETVAGYMELAQLAGIAGLERIAFGSVDFAIDSGITDDGDAMTAIRNQIVLVSRHAGLLAPIDGVSLEIGDEERVRADSMRSRRLGFGGKLCIHPRQVVAVNAAFRPTAADVEWAKRVLAAFDASNGAATTVDGKMIDKPVVERARCIAREAGLETA